MAALPLALVVGCDPDGDGLSKKDEALLGTDPKLADTDGDGLDDGAEVDLGTDPLNADTDGDGLVDGAEGPAGADPLVADTDGDGFLDGEEVDAGVDPADKWSWPFTGGTWPDYSDGEGIVAQGWNPGDVIANFDFTDQYGGTGEIYDFYGMVVLLNLSAGWCVPCQDVASTAESLWVAYREEGFLIVHVMLDDWYGGGVNQAFLGEWADEFGLHFPVVLDAESTAANGLYYAGLFDGSIPFQILVDRQGRVDSHYTGSDVEAAVEARLEDLLAH